MNSVRRRNSRPTHRARYAALLGVVAVVAFGQISASAELKLPELPLPTATPVQDPLNLEDLLNLDQLLNGEDLPVSTDLGEVVDSTTGTVSNLLGGTTGDPPAPGGTGAPPASAPGAPTVDSWSTEGLLPAEGATIPTRVGSEKLTWHSYAAAVGQGFARAARRAAELAGPVAAPMVLGLFAVGLLFVAGRGPGRLVKVEEERQAFRERRTFRL